MMTSCGGGSQPSSSSQAVLLPESVTKSSLAGKIIVGYQGWFGCPGDFEGNTAWFHWFDQSASPNRFIVDALPALAGLDASDLCDTGLTRADGTPLQLFSSQNKNVVNIHFRWMKEHDIDTVAVQRFVSELADPTMRKRSDNVLKHIRSAAELHARSFYVVYDISNADPRTVADDIRRDWQHLVTDLRLTDSPYYLRDKGKPMLQLWGFGFKDRPGQPDQAAALINDLKNGRNGMLPVTLIGGVPANWRILSGDSRTEPEWAKVYRSYDVISPWTVGHYQDELSLSRHINANVIPDMWEAANAGVVYLPVIFPGFSWRNLMMSQGNSSQAILNQIPRNCGNFLWKQIAQLHSVNASAFYAAMFDEVDESTALFPIESNQTRLAADTRMVTLDIDGCALPNDWYLSILQKGALFLKTKVSPPAELSTVLQP